MLLNVKVEEAEESLIKLIEDEKLEIELSALSFPTKAIVKKDITKVNQISMIENGEPYNGYLEFVFEDELILKIQDFKISDDLLNKIKNKLKKWHYAYLELFYEQRKSKGYLEDLDD